MVRRSARKERAMINYTHYILGRPIVCRLGELVLKNAPPSWDPAGDPSREAGRFPARAHARSNGI